MYIFLFFVILLLIISVIVLLTNSTNLRVHIAYLKQEGKERDFRWNRGRIVSYMFVGIAFIIAGLSIMFMENIFLFLSMALMLLICAIFQYQLVQTAVKEVKYYRKRHSEDSNQIQKERYLLRKYVHDDLLRLFDQPSLDDIEAGQNKEVRVKILLIDFHNYVVSQGIASKDETFRFFSRCVNLSSSILHEHDCLITHTQESGILVTFDSKNLGTVDAVTEIRNRLLSTNRKKDDAPANTFGSPLNCTLLQGLVTFGIISNGKTLESIVTSETIDLSYQIKQLARRLHVPMIVDEFSKRTHEKTNRHNFRYIGQIENKLSGQVLNTYEVLDLHNDDYKEPLITTREYFEEARRSHENGDFRKAYSQYSHVLSHNPHDFLAQYFQQKCATKIEVDN